MKTEPKKFLKWPQTYFCSYCYDASMLRGGCKQSSAVVSIYAE